MLRLCRYPLQSSGAPLSLCPCSAALILWAYCCGFLLALYIPRIWKGPLGGLKQEGATSSRHLYLWYTTHTSVSDFIPLFLFLIVSEAFREEITWLFSPNVFLAQWDSSILLLKALMLAQSAISPCSAEMVLLSRCSGLCDIWEPMELQDQSVCWGCSQYTVD